MGPTSQAGLRASSPSAPKAVSAAAKSRSETAAASRESRYFLAAERS